MSTSQALYKALHHRISSVSNTMFSSTLFTLLLCLVTAWAAPNAGPLTKPGSRIINGQKATQGQFPFQAAVFTTEPFSPEPVLCGGSLISDQWVLTAAHCIVDAISLSAVTVSLGSNSLTDADPNRVTRNVSALILHEDYNPNTLQNDVALIQLEQSVVLNDNINLVQVATEDIADGTIATVSGWGLTSDDDPALSPDLLYVPLVTISNAACGAAFGLTLGHYAVCANSTGDVVQAVCSSDSGGPLVVTDDSGNAIQHGVVSFGSSLGCESGLPSGFTRVVHFSDWILTNSGIAV